jgi:hypothetical protein
VSVLGGTAALLFGLPVWVCQVPSIVRRVERIVRHFMPAEEVRRAMSRAEYRQYVHGTLVCAESCLTAQAHCFVVDRSNQSSPIDAHGRAEGADRRCRLVRPCQSRDEQVLIVLTLGSACSDVVRADARRAS